MIPQRISREALRDGYIKVMNDLYTAENFFGKLDALMIDGKLDMVRGRSQYWKKHPFNFLKWQSLRLVQSIGLYYRLMTGIPEANLRREYHRRVMNLIRKRWDPGIWLYYLIKVAFHYHANTLATGKGAIVNSY